MTDPITPERVTLTEAECPTPERFCNGVHCPIHDPAEMVVVQLGEGHNAYQFRQERGTIFTSDLPMAFVDLEETP